MSSHEGKTREVRRAENPTDSGATDTHWQGDAARRSESSRGISQRAIGTNSQGTDHFGAITGGILGQLIADTEDRINEAAECLAWYQRELDKNQQRLANLRHLEELAKQQEAE